MGKKGSWVVQVTPKIKEDMEETARAAYENGSNIRQDAITLFEVGLYPRSAALAILSEEEFSKAFILKICAQQGRLDSNIYKALRRHPEKQGISEAMREYFEWFVENYKRVMELNRHSLIPVQPSMHPGDKKMDEILSKAKSRFKKPIKDHLKQDSIYVGIDKFAKISSIPNQIGEVETKACLDESFAFKVVTEVLFGDYSNVENLEKLSQTDARTARGWP